MYGRQMRPCGFTKNPRPRFLLVRFLCAKENEQPKIKYREGFFLLLANKQSEGLEMSGMNVRKGAKINGRKGKELSSLRQAVR